MLVVVVLSVVLVGWLYEAAALRWRCWPTITDLMQSHPVANVLSIVVITAAAVWAIAHARGLV